MKCDRCDKWSDEDMTPVEYSTGINWLCDDCVTEMQSDPGDPAAELPHDPSVIESSDPCPECGSPDYGVSMVSNRIVKVCTACGYQEEASESEAAEWREANAPRHGARKPPPAEEV